jgi:hypothetical protein
MPFYIEMPKDEFFNTGHRPQIIEGEARPWKAYPDMIEIVVADHEELKKSWPTVLMIHGWVEVEGPSRKMTHEEYVAYIGGLINRRPEVADAAMVTLKDGSRVPLVVARVCLLGLRQLLRDDPVGFYELVTATRNPNHDFFGNYAERLRERGMLSADNKPAGVLRDVILNAVEGEMEQMRLVNPERSKATA